MAGKLVGWVNSFNMYSIPQPIITNTTTFNNEYLTNFEIQKFEVKNFFNEPKKVLQKTKAQVKKDTNLLYLVVFLKF